MSSQECAARTGKPASASKKGEWEEIRGGLGFGGGRKLDQTVSLRSESPGCCLKFQNGREILSCFHMEIGLEVTLSLGRTEAKTKFSEPNTPFNQPLKPRRREGRKGRAKGQRLAFHLDLVLEVAVRSN